MNGFDIERLRIGVPPVFCARVLAYGLSACTETVLEEQPVTVLSRLLSEGALDAALLPPLAALQLSPCRLVPGIGIAARPSALPGLRRLVGDAGSGVEYPLLPGGGEEEDPVALWVWVCRFRAPYPRLRRLLALAQQNGLAELPLFARQAEEELGLNAGMAAQSFGELRYRIASAEVEGLRRLKKYAVEQGLCPPDAVLEFC